MKTYEVEQYEIHTSKYRVKADSEAEAIAKQLDGEGDCIDNSLEFIEIADACGLPVADYPELAAALRALNIPVDSVIPSIRSIEMIDDEDD
jgi:hypothetical protein